MGGREQRLSAPAKINTYLDILGKQPGGFHELESIFQTVDLCDQLQIRENEAHAETRISYAQGTMDFSALGENDICWRTVNVLRSACADIPGIDIHIEKCIPVGAGLGGASSDAAAILKTLAAWYGVDHEQQQRLALQLGSDVPFFLLGGAAYARGRGELLTPIPLLHSDPVYLILGLPAQSTAAVFAAMSDAERGPRAPCGLAQAQTTVFNRLESVTRRLQPTLDGLFRQADEKGIAIHMSGSGSACFSFDPQVKQLSDVTIITAHMVDR